MVQSALADGRTHTEFDIGSQTWSVDLLLVATIGAFGPLFVFIMGLFPYFARVRENDIIQTALTGVNAAVVGAILGATVTLAAESFVDIFTVVLAVVTFGLFVRGTHATYLILGGGGVGMAWYFIVL